MRVLILLAIIFSFISFVLPQSPLASELKVTNLSKIEIYPTVTSKTSKERFGVVSISGSATVGFSPFKLGDKVKIAWEEGESYDLSNANIDTSCLRSISKEVASIHLIYHGKGIWILKVFDKNDREIGSVP